MESTLFWKWGSSLILSTFRCGRGRTYSMGNICFWNAELSSVSFESVKSTAIAHDVFLSDWSLLVHDSKDFCWLKIFDCCCCCFLPLNRSDRFNIWSAVQGTLPPNSIAFWAKVVFSNSWFQLNLSFVQIFVLQEIIADHSGSNVDTYHFLCHQVLIFHWAQSVFLLNNLDMHRSQLRLAHWIWPMMCSARTI